MHKNLDDSRTNVLCSSCVLRVPETPPYQPSKEDYDS
jgi:hypothetical protein